MKILKENFFSKKQRCWILFFSLVLILTFTGVLVSVYRSGNNPSPFENRVIQALSLANFPFMERKSFFFPENSSSDKKNVSKENEPQVALEEASSIKKSKSADWWLNSGGVMLSGREEFSTNIGPLPESSSWRKLYAKNNSRDTDNGYYPQNIFRLVTRNQWKNFSQSVYFNIESVNMSKSDYRNESNGVLLFNRYQDGDNLYYAGLRVDGDAVIKKKIGGKYYTMAEKEVFAGKSYDRDENPNLIPEEKWIGIKSEVESLDDNTVGIKFYVDKEGNGNWDLILEVKDKEKKYGKDIFAKKGFAGIRTDFMDVSFKNYAIFKI